MWMTNNVKRVLEEKQRVYDIYKNMKSKED